MEEVQVDLSSGVMVNTSAVTLADVTSDNGVVHVIDAVLLPTALASIENVDGIEINIFPNPATEFITVQAKSDCIQYNQSARHERKHRIGTIRRFR